MTRILALAATAVVAATALGQGNVPSKHFSSLAAFDPFFLGGLEFTAGADTQKIYVSQAVPAAAAQLPFTQWNNGVPHAFKIVFNTGGITGIEVDDTFTTISPVMIGPATNGLLLKAFVDGGERQAVISNLKLTLPGFLIFNVRDAVVVAPATDYLLIRAFKPLAAGFILSGTIAFSWTGPLPPSGQQLFELSPVQFCEPCDTNCDGSVNVFDVQGLVDGIQTRETCSSCSCDTNFDGTINMFDIQGFVECLTGED